MDYIATQGIFAQPLTAFNVIGFRGSQYRLKACLVYVMNTHLLDHPEDLFAALDSFGVKRRCDFTTPEIK